ncbi:Autophagy-related protein 29 [Colletotrichum siamense]|nr:Autophagy-related protein 29 [Colletotrichum siamense]
MTDPNYTVFVRLPILRGEFTDPPPVGFPRRRRPRWLYLAGLKADAIAPLQVTWDSTKDDVLWNILSGAAKTEIDWNELAAHFDVTVDFLLQQVAYLTERHTAQLRAQVRKATAAAKGSAAPSPIPGAEPHSHQRTISALSIRRDSPLPRNDASTPATPITTSLRPNLSRNGSAGTITRNLGGEGTSTARPGATTKPSTTSRPSNDGQQQRRRLSSLPIQSTPRSPEPASPPDESSSPASSDDESSPAQSRIIRRPPRFQQQRDGGVNLDDEDDDDAEPAFLQYKPQSASNASSAQDMGSTLRGDPRNARRTPKGKERIHHSETSDSSTSSPALISRSSATSDHRRPVAGGGGPLSPRRAAELSGKSPSSKGKGYSRDGSDGTPSMGSSFSDLDDASVTQSALEEALASKMQDGAIGSRFSISQAFRSRYMPKPGQQ